MIVACVLSVRKNSVQAFYDASTSHHGNGVLLCGVIHCVYGSQHGRLHQPLRVLRTSTWKSHYKTRNFEFQPTRSFNWIERRLENADNQPLGLEVVVTQVRGNHIASMSCCVLLYIQNLVHCGVVLRMCHGRSEIVLVHCKLPWGAQMLLAQYLMTTPLFNLAAFNPYSW